MREQKIDERTTEVLKPIFYADIFDFPLTFEEIYHFLEFKATPDEVKTLLDQALEDGDLVLVDGYYSLPGKTHLVDNRRERWQASQVLWPKAIYYGRWIASLPFVRMVSVTGSLAVDNPRDGVDDIDYLIVTRSNRLWLCRALIILMVRYGHRNGVHLCPNYLITKNALYFEDNNLFTAREMVQMVPLYGQAFYLEMRQINDWVTGFLPQGNDLNMDALDDQLAPVQYLIKRLGEFVLGNVVGDWLEKILRTIQITKHTRLVTQKGTVDQVIFTADVCKGHYDGHNGKIMTAYRERIQNYEIERNYKIPVTELD
ncbi:MAG TPA: hypothetical protein VGD99_01925 [Anaerolineae bacterium]